MNTTMKSKVLLLLLLSSLFYIDSYGQVESHVFDNAVDNRHLSLPNTRSIHNLPVVDANRWPNGFYVIRVEGNSEVLTKKIAL